MSFTLEYLRKETHLVLPRYSPYLITQNIYDLLFQYVLTPERENLLNNFVQKLEAYARKRTNTPFSIPLADLEFLGEGWQELKMLNWFEVPISVFALHTDAEQQEEAIGELKNLMLMNYDEAKHLIYVYPREMVW